MRVTIVDGPERGSRPVHTRIRAGWIGRAAALLFAVLAAVSLSLTGCGSDSSPSDTGGQSTLALPSDFPTGDVPVVEGTVLSAGGDAADGWNLTVQAPATTADALDSAVRALTDAGFREVQRGTEGGSEVVVLSGTRSGSTYTVQVGKVAGAASGPNSVFYQVSRS